MIHELKTIPQFFNRILEGTKSFECRVMDRDYQINDILKLQEFDPATEYTGRSIAVIITYVLEGGQYGIEKGWCVMGISLATN